MQTGNVVTRMLMCVAVAGWLGMSQVAEATDIEYCGESTEVTLLAGQSIEAGSVVVLNDDDTLCVLVEVDAPWLIKEYHVSIVSDPGDFPTNRPGNPLIGPF